MGEIQIQKIQRTVQVKDGDNKRKKVQKTYGKIIYRKTLSLDDMAEHIMKHGSVYTEDPNFLCKHMNILYKGLGVEGFVDITKVRLCKAPKDNWM